MLLAALPARPVQLAHAVQAMGFDLVIPVSWGEEVIADHTLRMLGQAGPRAMVFCSCPLVRTRLMQVGNELTPHLISTVAPPVAAARYLRALQPDTQLRITFLGSCEGAVDAAIDVRIAPLDFLKRLEQRGISAVRQPTMFDAVIPPDRRRHWSLPGGVPSHPALAERGAQHRLEVLINADLASSIADHLLLADQVVVDLAPQVGCACAGSVAVHHTAASREALAALEPPRSALPVIEGDIRVDVELSMPYLVASEGGGSRPVLRLADKAPKAIESTGKPTASNDVARTDTPVVPTAPAAENRRPPRPRIAVTPPGIPLLDAAEPARTAPPTEPVPPAPTPPVVELRMLTFSPGGESGNASPAVPRAAAPPPAGGDQAAPHDAPRSDGPAPRRRTPTHGLHHFARQSPATRVSGSDGSEVPRAYAALRGRRTPPHAPAIPSPSGDTATLTPPDLPAVVEADELIPVVPIGTTPEPVILDEAPAPDTEADQSPAPVDSLPVAAAQHVTSTPVVEAVVLEQPRGVGPKLGSRKAPPPGPPPSPERNGRRLWGLLASVVAIAALTLLLKLVFDP